MDDNIADRVRELVVEYLDVADEKVTEGANFVDDLGADSLDTIELIMLSRKNLASKLVTTRRKRSSPSRTRSTSYLKTASEYRDRPVPLFPLPTCLAFALVLRPFMEPGPGSNCPGWIGRG